MGEQKKAMTEELERRRTLKQVEADKDKGPCTLTVRVASFGFRTPLRSRVCRILPCTMSARVNLQHPAVLLCSRPRRRQSSLNHGRKQRSSREKLSSRRVCGRCGTQIRNSLTSFTSQKPGSHQFWTRWMYCPGLCLNA